MITVEIDPNVRVRGNQSYGMVNGPPFAALDEIVAVIEPESGLHGTAVVTDSMEFGCGECQLVYLAVDWGTLRIDS